MGGGWWIRKKDIEYSNTSRHSEIWYVVRENEKRPEPPYWTFLSNALKFFYRPRYTDSLNCGMGLSLDGTENRTNAPNAEVVALSYFIRDCVFFSEVL